MKLEKLSTVQGMWKNFCAIIRNARIFTSIALPPAPSTNNISLGKTKCSDDEGFMQPSKAFKITKLNHITPEISIQNKFDSLNSNFENENKNPKMKATSEPKLQTIYMKMVRYYISIIEEIEQEYNTKFKKKINGELVQVYLNDILEYRAVQEILADRKIQFFAI